MTSHANATAPPVLPWVAVAVTTLALMLTLTPNREVGLWTGTAAAGALGVVTAFACARPLLRHQLALGIRGAVAGIAGGALMALATHAAYPVAVTLWPALADEAATLYARIDAPPGRYAAVPILALVVAAEELIWRGIAYPLLARRYGRAIAVTGACALYVVPQLASGSWLLPLLALGCGAIWTLQRALTDTLWICGITHLVWDLLVMVVFPLG